MSNLKQNIERLYEVIKRPLITEKSSIAMAEGQYAFEVLQDATKTEIRKAVELVFPGRKVKKVRTAHMPSHQKRLGKTLGRTQSGKKAIVTIEGEPIEEIIGA